METAKIMLADHAARERAREHRDMDGRLVLLDRTGQKEGGARNESVSNHMTIEEWIAIIRMLLEERHKYLLAELRELARNHA